MKKTVSYIVCLLFSFCFLIEGAKKDKHGVMIIGGIILGATIISIATSLKNNTLTHQRIEKRKNKLQKKIEHFILRM